MMDEFSLHNFVIWNAATMRQTPEFESFQRSCEDRWRAIEAIITQLEDLMARTRTQAIIVGGWAAYLLAEQKECSGDYNCNLDELLSLIAEEGNGRSIFDKLGVRRPPRTRGADAGASTMRSAQQLEKAAATRIQCCMARHRSQRRMRRRRWLKAAAIRIQTRARVFLERSRLGGRLSRRRADMQRTWERHLQALRKHWGTYVENGTPCVAPRVRTQGSRLVILLPSCSASEYVRVGAYNAMALQNCLTGALHFLTDPHIQVVLVTPQPLRPVDVNYLENLMAMQGVAPMPKRLHCIYPEMMADLPAHVPVSMALWCSAGALRDIRSLCASTTLGGLLVPSGDFGWAERRLAYFLDCPFLGGDPAEAQTLSQRSSAHQIFEAAGVNTPVGDVEIHSLEDVALALAKLIALNPDVAKWALFFNDDLNGESYAYFDVNMLASISALRGQLAAIVSANSGDPNIWYSEDKQMEVRKRLVLELIVAIPRRLVIQRADLYPNWSVYARFLDEQGGVVHALPAQPAGVVHGLCFIDPHGEVCV
jgi:hypothetical protein